MNGGCGRRPTRPLQVLLPPLEPPPPELPPLEGVDGAAGAAAGAAGALGAAEPLLAAPPLEPPALLLLELYKSVYQPPPFRMKLPPEICRFAVFSWHFGHSSRGAAEMRCSASQPLPQFVHTYS